MFRNDEDRSLPGFDPLKRVQNPEMVQWRAARDRVLRYLDALETPAERSLEICRQVLQITREQACKDDVPVTAAMAHLYNLLSDEMRIPVLNGRPEHIPSVPELNRGKMVPEDLGFAPVRQIRKRQRRQTDRKRRNSDLWFGLVLVFTSLIL